MRWFRQIVGRLAFVAAATIAVPAVAQTISIVSITALALGNTASAASGNTVFTVVPSTGAITKTGLGARISVGTVRATVTILCTGTNPQCSGATINVRVGSDGSPTGRALAMTNFTAASGTATVVAAPAAGNPITFQISPIPRNTNQTFFVGGNYTITDDASAGATGAATSSLNVRVAVSPAAPLAPGTSSNSTATVYRSLSVTKNSDLVFGSMLRPASGSSTITIDPTTGVRTQSGLALLVASPTPSRAAFTVNGEGGRIISVTVPASFNMTRSGGAETLLVTTSRDPAGSLTLTGALGAAGTASFGVGGSFPVTSATVRGGYTANFNVVFDYN